MNLNINNIKKGNKGIEKVKTTLNKINNEGNESIFIPLHSGKVTTLEETIEAMEKEGN